MADVHRAIEAYGRQGAKQLDFDPRIIDVAANYMGAEQSDISFLYSGWAMGALPHRRLPDDESWQIATEYVTLIVQPGLRPNTAGKPIPVGVPYGPRARLICLYLQTQAMRTKSREVELGGSLHAWVRRLRLPMGGKTMTSVREQAERLARCRLTLQVKHDGRSGLMNQNILDAALFVEDTDGQPGRFIERAKLSEQFYDQLLKHPVPVEENAIAAIANSSMAIDIYCWLAYRLQALKTPTTISWKALHAQFGAGHRERRFFRNNFAERLQLALSVYPDARVEDSERGLTLHPCAPPVAPKIVSLASRRR